MNSDIDRVFQISCAKNGGDYVDSIIFVTHNSENTVYYIQYNIKIIYYIMYSYFDNYIFPKYNFFKGFSDRRVVFQQTIAF